MGGFTTRLMLWLFSLFVSLEHRNFFWGFKIVLPRNSGARGHDPIIPGVDLTLRELIAPE